MSQLRKAGFVEQFRDMPGGGEELGPHLGLIYEYKEHGLVCWPPTG